jgi:hypothetical protein
MTSTFFRVVLFSNSVREINSSFLLDSDVVHPIARSTTALKELSPWSQDIIFRLVEGLDPLRCPFRRK